jgi:hypothetical protein
MTLKEKMTAAIPGLTEADFCEYDGDFMVVFTPEVVRWLRKNVPLYKLWTWTDQFGKEFCVVPHANEYVWQGSFILAGD